MDKNNAVDLSAFEGVTTPADAEDLNLSATTDPAPAPKPEEPKPNEPVKPEPKEVPAEPEEKEPVASAAALLADLERLVQSSTAFEEPEEPAKPEKPEEAGKPGAESDELQAQIDEMEDGPEKEVAKRMLARVRAAEEREARREAAALQEAEAEALNNYVAQVKQFAKDYPGATGEDLETIAARHAALVKDNEAMSEFTFEEIARRMHGAKLEAWRTPAPRPAPAPKDPTPPNGRSPGHPVSPGLGSGAPGDKKPWTPGPGRGFKDVSDQLVKEGAFRAAITKS